MSQDGYTLIELLMSMAIFSIMLLIISMGVLSLMRIYQNGIASRNTQQNARFGMEQMVRAGRSAYKVTSSGSANQQNICFYISNNGLEYYINGSQLWEATLKTPTSPCDGSGITGSHAITSSEVTVTRLSSSIIGNATSAGDSLSVQLDLTIGTGSVNNSLDSTGNCITGAGAQYCSTTALHSGVTLRGGQGVY